MNTFREYVMALPCPSSRRCEATCNRSSRAGPLAARRASTSSTDSDFPASARASALRVPCSEMEWLEDAPVMVSPRGYYACPHAGGRAGGRGGSGKVPARVGACHLAGGPLGGGEHRR